MKNSFFAFLFAALSVPAFSQQSLEVTLGVGATPVNIEKMVLLDEVLGSFATDWGVVNGGLSAQYFFGGTDNIKVGAELKYHYLYWYSVSVPYGSQTIYREYSVSAVNVAPLVRVGDDAGFSFDFGPSVISSGGLKLGFLMSANYGLSVSDKIEIPIKLRLDGIPGIVFAAPVSLQMGVRVHL
ncbi:MAG: hypothetical protein OEY56_08550 [Cyclobacteriaceae bacterium]|nr:hypothetical protein [Cyclobacteriaceae bacterium]